MLSGIQLDLGELPLLLIASPVSGIVADARNDRRSSMIALYLSMLFCCAALNFTAAPLGTVCTLQSVGLPLAAKERV